MNDMFNVPFSLVNMGPIGEAEPTHNPYESLNAEALRKELQAFMSYCSVSIDSRHLLQELHNRLFAKKEEKVPVNGEPVTSLDHLLPGEDRGIQVHYIDRDYENNQLYVYFSSSNAHPKKIIVQVFDKNFCPVGREPVDGVIPPPREITLETLTTVMMDNIQTVSARFAE